MLTPDGRSGRPVRGNFGARSAEVVGSFNNWSRGRLHWKPKTMTVS
jgi:hypothetical protein